MRQDCFNYESCRKPVSECVKGAECFWHRPVVHSKEDGAIENIYYLTLECGHKTTVKGSVPKMAFCTQCFKFL